MSAPIEVTTRYVTTVDTLPEAWEFVMDRIDQVGPDPRITISPLQQFSLSDGLDGSLEPQPRQFEVLVEGMVSEAIA
jgi:hypothetical protein